MTTDDNISIHDVARMAGVSISTVSRVLNGRDRVSQETRKTVEAAIEQLNFFPNNRARALSRKRTDTIGLIVPGFLGDYFGRLMEGVDEEARLAGFHLMISKANTPQTKVDSIKRILTEGRVDGLILMLDELKGKVLDHLEDIRSPLVILDTDVGHRSLDNVLVDNRTGAHLATRHMLEAHGLRNLLFIGGPEGNTDSLERAAGFRAALTEMDVPCPNDRFYTATAFDYDAGYKMAHELMNKIKPGQDWGLVAANDDLAYGMLDAFIRAGLNVPQDIALIGYDDSLAAKLGRPRLSSVHVPLKEIGHTAVRMILDRLNNPGKEAAKVILKGKLVIRNSCGCTEAN